MPTKDIVKFQKVQLNVFRFTLVIDKNGNRFHVSGNLSRLGI